MTFAACLDQGSQDAKDDGATVAVTLAREEATVTFSFLLR